MAIETTFRCPVDLSFQIRNHMAALNVLAALRRTANLVSEWAQGGCRRERSRV